MPPDPPSSSTRGMLVVTVDRLPAWMLSSWGATWVSTPAFDALAATGLTLDRLLATGCDPAATLSDLAAGGGLWRAARAAGWSAVLVTDDPRLPERPPGVDLVEAVATPVTRSAADDEATNLARLFARAHEVVAGGRHRLVWCHASSLGVAWDAPTARREAYADPEDPPPPAGAAVPSFFVTAETDPDAVMGWRQAFAGQLTLLDRCLGGLVERVRGLGSAWTIAVIGLRGMPLGLHGEVGCPGGTSASGRPYGEWVHLPAIIVDPEGRMAAQRYGDLVAPIDVGATLLEVLGAPVPDGCHSLGGLFVEWRHDPRDRVIVDCGEAVAVATPGWHLVGEPAAGGARAFRLFAKPDDFFELSDVADRCPAVVEELATLLEPGMAARPLSAVARGG